jgi:hypothetical protein
LRVDPHQRRRTIRQIAHPERDRFFGSRIRGHAFEPIDPKLTEPGGEMCLRDFVNINCRLHCGKTRASNFIIMIGSGSRGTSGRTDG